MAVQPAKLQFSLGTMLLLVVPVSWFLAMTRIGGVGHVTVAFYLGAIT